MRGMNCKTWWNDRSKSARRTIIGLAGVAAIISTSASGCNGDDSPQQSEAAIRNGSYEQLTAAQPAHGMTYSPTRATVNGWIDTWGKPGKLSYVYLQNANGEITGYYVLKGLPVSYCVALTPNYTFVGTPDDGNNAKDQQVPAPSVDGVYYSGGQCNTYYGFDATTGAYVEYTAGLGINVLLYDQPLPAQKIGKAIPLGPTVSK